MKFSLVSYVSILLVVSCANPPSGSGSIVKETFVARDGTAFVLVEYSLENVKESTARFMQNEEALFNEFKASQAFEALNAEIKN